MSKRRTAVIAAAAAFAASPRGKRLLAQAKEYATRPENQRRAQELVAKARTKLPSRGSAKPGGQTPSAAASPAESYPVTPVTPVTPVNPTSPTV